MYQNEQTKGNYKLDKLSCHIEIRSLKIPI